MKTSEIQNIYEQYGFIIYGRCVRILGSKENARDATQAVFVKLIEHYDSIEDKEKVVPWIFSAARNYCFNELRFSKKLSYPADRGRTEQLGSDSLPRRSVTVVSNDTICYFPSNSSDGISPVEFRKWYLYSEQSDDAVSYFWYHPDIGMIGYRHYENGRLLTTSILSRFTKVYGY